MEIGFQIGMRVSLFGLRAMAALNSKQGTILGEAQTGDEDFRNGVRRWRLRLDLSGRCITVTDNHMSTVGVKKYLPGMRVRIINL